MGVKDWSARSRFDFSLPAGWGLMRARQRRAHEAPRWPLSCDILGRLRLKAVGCVVLGGLAAVLPVQAAAPARLITGVSVSPPFFNPSIGQQEKITFTSERAGTVQLEIVDRDGFPIRGLEPHAVRPGPVSFSWDGRDNAGLVVPDEAYAIRISFSGDGARDLYDPAQHFQSVPQDHPSCTYSRSEGILSYTLPWPARVHILAGQATQDPMTHVSDGPVLKTVVDRQPRAAGSVVETWNGLDEGGTISVPDLPHFVVAITIAPLPENAILSVGNRKSTFLDYALQHRPKKALLPRKRDAARQPHHVGLTALEDHDVPLTLKVNAQFDPVARVFRTQGGPLEATLTLDPHLAPHFLISSSDIEVFVDEKLVATKNARRSPARLSIAGAALSAGRHRVAFNWASGAGPVAVTAVQVDVIGQFSHEKSGNH